MRRRRCPEATAPRYRARRRLKASKSSSRKERQTPNGRRIGPRPAV
ncbi:hypothetical protein CKAH01_14005 [Colletotrichum kahawae]|uniref:Uncharacterized protein n=1 Tax=Colletotrichum kahawae TaxID=34407 RepID=A0AAD9YNZ2_COLKA|nr:hypothetical protein CKAH01_14005 [Colletotrichum kahawae]